ncbi:MAG TPA: hypothetical protein VFZ25_07660 [Chloroflexota bacterium]|nr:hypothetical protein [Chloroflexota bacterium]
MRCLFWALALIVLVAVVFPALVAMTVFTAALFFTVARFAVPWLLVGLGVWLIVGRAGRHHRRSRRNRWSHWDRDDWHAWGPSQSRSTWSQTRPAPPTSTPDPPPDPNRPTTLPTTLPIDVEVKVEQIRHKVNVLLGYAERFPIFSQDLYLVRQTASEYLPKTLDAYKALAVSGSTEVTADSGKTAHQELSEQLDLLDSKLTEIAEDLQRRDMDKLLANRRFLEERFGHRSA